MRDLDILTLQFFILHNTDTISNNMYSMYDDQPSVREVLTSSIFISLSLITPTPSHFLYLPLVFSVLINNNILKNEEKEGGDEDMYDRGNPLGNVIDSGMGLSITIDKFRVFINKTLSILSAYQ